MEKGVGKGREVNTQGAMRKSKMVGVGRRGAGAPKEEEEVGHGRQIWVEKTQICFHGWCIRGTSSINGKRNDRIHSIFNNLLTISVVNE